MFLCALLICCLNQCVHLPYFSIYFTTVAISNCDQFPVSRFGLHGDKHPHMGAFRDLCENFFGVCVCARVHARVIPPLYACMKLMGLEEYVYVTWLSVPRLFSRKVISFYTFPSNAQGSLVFHGFVFTWHDGFSSFFRSNRYNVLSQCFYQVRTARPWQKIDSS